MAKYTSVSVSGYNATPPADDGTVSEANKVKWATHKTKLGDPLKTAIEAVNTNLVSAFDVGPTALTTSTTLGATHYGDFVQTSGAGLTHTLTDAATLGAGWHTYLVSTDANDVTIGRATGADTINGTAANVTLYGNTAARIFVNAAGNGFFIEYGRISNNTFVSMQLFTAGIGPNYLQNIGIAASVATAALTVAFKTKALTDASSSDPIQIAFRNATLTTGDYVVRSGTAAASVVAPSGATLGFTASQTGYLYVYALDNAGTIEAVLSGSNHWDTSTVQSTTAIDATADSGSVLYSTTARTNVPIRYIGKIKIQTGAVAGEWDNEDTVVTLYKDKGDGSQGLSIASAATTNIWNGGDSNHITATTATVTMTIASPCVVTHTAHGKADGDPIHFTTTGALPTGLSVDTLYFVKTPLTNTYNVAATSGGTAINTTGSQSGTHTVTYGILGFGTAPYAGARKKLIFDSPMFLVHSANMSFTAALDVFTAVDDTCEVYADTTTQFEIDYVKKSGGSSGLTTISSGSLPTGANVLNITSIPQTFSALILQIVGASSALSGAVTMNTQLSTDNGSTYDTTASNYEGFKIDEAAAVTNNTVADLMFLAASVNVANTASCTITLSGYQSGPSTQIAGRSATSAPKKYTIQGVYLPTGGVNALRILLSSADFFDAGTYALYGVR